MNKFHFKSSKPNVVVFEVGVGNLFLSQSAPLWGNSLWSFYLFEPNPLLYQDLARRIYSKSNIKLYNIAFHHKEGFHDFVLAGDNSFLSKTNPPIEKTYHGEYERLFCRFKVPVLCSTFDLFDPGDIDILYLSVEGNEWSVLQRTRSRPTLVVLKNYSINAYGYVFPNWTEIQEWLNVNSYFLLQSDENQLVFSNQRPALST